MHAYVYIHVCMCTHTYTHMHTHTHTHTCTHTQACIEKGKETWADASFACKLGVGGGSFLMHCVIKEKEICCSEIPVLRSLLLDVQGRLQRGKIFDQGFIYGKASTTTQVVLSFVTGHSKTFFPYIVGEYSPYSPILLKRNFHTRTWWVKIHSWVLQSETFMVYIEGWGEGDGDSPMALIWENLCGVDFVAIFQFYYFTNILDFLSTHGEKKYKSH